ncbi:MAG: hypothetical protein ACYTG6_02095 [Planctomycetota bacterium]|jgi:tetratricopeptide (TPR) repeat protein
MGRRTVPASAWLFLALIFGLGTMAVANEEDDAATLRERLAAAQEAGAGDAELAALHASLAEALVREGEAYAALQHLEAVLAKRDRPEDHLRYGEVLLRIARENMQSLQASSVQVLPYLLDALDAARAAGDDVDVQARRRHLEAESRYWMGDLDLAAAAWEATAFDDLPEGEARRARELWGHALYGLGRHAEAAAAFRAAGNQRAEASAWSAAGDGEKAIGAYAPLLRAMPGDRTLLDEAFRAARFAGAEETLAKLLAGLDTNDLEGADRAVLLVTRARVAAAMGEVRAALNLLEVAATADPASAEPLMLWGSLRLDAPASEPGDPMDEAVDAWIRALERDPTHAQAASALWITAGNDYGSAWRSPDALARSLRAQRAIVEHVPRGNPDWEGLGLAWSNLGNTLRIAGLLEEALEAYDRAVEAEPYDPTIRSDRGLVLSALGRDDDALAAFEAAIDLDAAFEPARQNAARAHWRAARDAEAEAHLAAALESARATGRGAMRYRFLIDRVARTRRNETRR